jgi:hypothetical protein
MAGSCLLFGLKLANLPCPRMVNCLGAFLDVLDDPVFVDDERNAVGKQAGKIQYSVSLRHLLLCVRKQGKARAGFCGKLSISFPAVEADSQHLHARSFEPGDITLIRLDLLGSTRS